MNYDVLTYNMIYEQSRNPLLARHALILRVAFIVSQRNDENVRHYETHSTHQSASTPNTKYPKMEPTSRENLAI